MELVNVGDDLEKVSQRLLSPLPLTTIVFYLIGVQIKMTILLDNNSERFASQLGSVETVYKKHTDSLRAMIRLIIKMTIKIIKT